MQVRILYVPGCPNFGPARDLVQHAARTLGVDISVEETAVTGGDVQGFAGSPTILVEGCDVAPTVGGHSAPSCRLYENKENRGLPALSSVLNALSRHKDPGTCK